MAIEVVKHEYVIYGLIDPNTDEVRYVGKTYDIQERIKRHYMPSELMGNTHKNNWLKFLLAKGQRAEVVIICERDTYDELNAAEIMWIANYRLIGAPLTNATDGGEGALGRVVSETTRQKISEAGKGRRHTEEARQRMSEANKGREVSSETRQKISSAKTGTTHSEESKQKISAQAAIRYTEHPESHPMFGKTHSEDTKKLMSEATIKQYANPLDTETHKQCRKCKEVKPRDQFSPDKNVRDGKCSWCKGCMNAKCMKRYNERRAQL